MALKRFKNFKEGLLHAAWAGDVKKTKSELRVWGSGLPLNFPLNPPGPAVGNLVFTGVAKPKTLKDLQ